MILLVPNKHIRNDTLDTKRDSQLCPQASQIWAFYSNNWASGESEISSKGAFKWGLMIKQGFKKQICQVRQERLDEGEWTEGILTKLCLEFVCLFVFRIFQIGRIFSFCFNTILFFFLLYSTVLVLPYINLTPLGLGCCVWAFSSCGSRGLLSSRSVGASHCGGFPSCRARALGYVGFNSCRVQASVLVARGLSCRGMWYLPGPGIEPVSPALAGASSTTGPPREVLPDYF